MENKYSYKKIQMWLIVFIVVIMIGLCSTASLFFYSFVDRGTPVSDAIMLENASVMLLQNDEENLIKLEFSNISQEIVERYTLSLINQQGRTVETMNIEIEYSHENMKDYIYQPEIDVNRIYYYKIEKKPD